MRVLSLSAAEVRIFPDRDALDRAAAEEFLRAAQEAIHARDRFAVALAGGLTPQGLYSRLAANHHPDLAQAPWDKIHVFFGDERNVPPNHVDNNFHRVRETLLAKVPLPPGNIHRVRAELGARTAAADYERWLKSFFGLRESKVPQFDLILLGLGADGHTASLFPESEALKEQSRLVCANWVKPLDSFRITFTYPVLNAAAEVMFVVAGEAKAEALGHVLRGDPTGKTYPAQAVHPVSGRLLWMVDEAAASRLG